MDNNKLDTITNLFEGKEIRSIWDSEKEDYFFSVVDVINALTDSNEPRKYWSVLKTRLKPFLVLKYKQVVTFDIFLIYSNRGWRYIHPKFYGALAQLVRAPGS